jgi:hypothetical protein
MRGESRDAAELLVSDAVCQLGSYGAQLAQTRRLAALLAHAQRELGLTRFQTAEDWDLPQPLTAMVSGLGGKGGSGGGKAGGGGGLGQALPRLVSLRISTAVTHTHTGAIADGSTCRISLKRVLAIAHHASTIQLDAASSVWFAPTMSLWSMDRPA